MIWAVRWILPNLIRGYSSQGISANFTQQDAFVKTILCCKSLFCRSSTGLWVLWHFNRLLSLHNLFSALCAEQVSSGIARGERWVLLRSSHGLLPFSIPQQCAPWEALRTSVQNQRWLGIYFKGTIRHFAWAYLLFFRYKIYMCLVMHVWELLRQCIFSMKSS